jgi:metal-responsive CopG/Arc/MetJ family transcriptional regulator
MRITRPAMRVVSIKLSQQLDEELSAIAKRRNASRSAILREALESFAKGSSRSVTSVAADLVGSLRGPKDLSTNPKHLSGYGE